MCLLGDHGSGKSTFLRALGKYYREQGRRTCVVCLHRESPRAERRAALCKVYAADTDTIILFDGLEVLPLWTQLFLAMRMRWRSQLLIATMHKRFPFAELRSFVADDKLALELIELLTKTPVRAPLRAVALNALKQHRGNLRDVFAECYLAWPSLEHSSAAEADSTPGLEPGSEPRKVKINSVR